MEDKTLDKLWCKRHKKDVLFLKLIKDCEIEERDDYTYYIKKDYIMLKYNKINNTIDLNEDLIWDVFSDKFESDNTEQLLFEMVNTHTPFSIKSIYDIRELSSMFYNHDTGEIHFFKDRWIYRPY